VVLPRALDEIKASEADFSLDHKAAPVEQFACEHDKKAFAHDIVEAVAD